jgi:excisionase family DNA binding protein
LADSRTENCPDFQGEQELPLTATVTAPPPGSEWLSLGPASRLVGVDPDTLRRWADRGRVEAYATPGGHRRFRRADLDRVVETRRPTRRSLSMLGATPARLARAYARSYRATDVLGSGDYDDLDRDAFRTEGRRLITALLGYLDASSPAARNRWEADASASVRATGERLGRTGSDVLAVVTTFLAARRPFLAELAALGRRRSLDVAALTALYDEAAALLDRLLLELIDAFQPATNHPTTAKRSAR